MSPVTDGMCLEAIAYKNAVLQPQPAVVISVNVWVTTACAAAVMMMIIIRSHE
jgi:hypothetical protein